MSKVKGYINDNKDKILAILMLLITFFSALLSMGGKLAIFSTIMIAVIEVIIFYLKNGLTDKFFELCVAMVKLIVDVINGEYTETKMVAASEEEILNAPKDSDSKGAPKKKRVRICILTEDMIRDILTKNEKEDKIEKA